MLKKLKSNLCENETNDSDFTSFTHHLLGVPSYHIP